MGTREAKSANFLSYGETMSNSVVHLVNLKEQYSSIKAEVQEVMTRVVESTQFILGHEVQALEAEFAGYCGVRHGVGVASGTDALYLALLAVGVGPGHEVITAPNTFIATAAAVSHTGARVRFVDIEPDTYNMDPDLLERAITPRTRAILPVHLYGHPADMDPILRLAEKHGLQVIEDAAQSHGARYCGRRAGSLGHAACFSFYPGKNLGAYGDGGMVVTNDDRIAGKLRLLRDHGREDKYHHIIEGYNSRLDALQAAVLRVKLRRLDQWNALRRERAACYSNLLCDMGLGLPAVVGDVEHVFHLYVLRTSLRQQLQAELSRAGIETGIHYPVPLHLQPAYAKLGYRQGDFPRAEAIAKEILSLPLYPELSDTDLERVVEEIGIFCRSTAT